MCMHSMEHDVLPDWVLRRERGNNCLPSWAGSRCQRGKGKWQASEGEALHECHVSDDNSWLQRRPVLASTGLDAIPHGWRGGGGKVRVW